MLRCLTSLELLRAMGMPPTVLELPAGNLSDTPPILKEDLYACYMANTAMGMKGLNYYIFTGGPNFPGTGATGAVYDYHAPISAEGELRDTYGALKDFGLFLAENGWMQRAHRVSSVQLGFDWETSRFQEYAPPLGDVGMSDAWTYWNTAQNILCLRAAARRSCARSQAGLTSPARSSRSARAA